LAPVKYVATLAAMGSASGAKTWVLKPSAVAASASIFPNCPAPKMPMVEPGARGEGLGMWFEGNGFSLFIAPCLEAFGDAFILQCNNGSREQAGIGSSGLADGE